MSFSACASADVRAALAKACADLTRDERLEPLDVYRRLAQEAKVVYDTEKTKLRMTEHPLTADVARSHPALVDFSIETLETLVDAERNTTTKAVVVYVPPVAAAKKKQKTKEHLEVSFSYDRRYAGEPFGTTLAFTLSVALGYGKKTTLLHIKDDDEITPPTDDDEDADAAPPSDHSDEGANQDEEETEEDDEEEVEEEAEEEAEDVGEEHQEGDEDVGGDDDGETQELHVLGPDEKDWEYVEEFEFHEDVFETFHEWFGGDLSHQDFLTFMLAFPFTEDEYMVDDRVFDLVFNGDDSGDESDA
ncbi:hypothetical protein SPRG_03420 [Saprolegnia parasitica CBS 223.65]|uniref:Uncharacterized protein n=1 Tax=Saprolegnia parasitica (strain CBS 223.65) TaxID=695850 RepID=A0A067CP07_SAPPC|nr:hypothetical protein SPRG_03420 [Saprolegnia parasitica CBS 223.65]KDO32203.1 hypothetical protein SPRG_03420 [Saprolegnia parasitica CBS 223.65]|eukprot:XP_012197383.1 hypothetical protein SPRG_03420 [Saprolegnia parasitica CBS 223.65]